MRPRPGPAASSAPQVAASSVAVKYTYVMIRPCSKFDSRPGTSTSPTARSAFVPGSYISNGTGSLTVRSCASPADALSSTSRPAVVRRPAAWSTAAERAGQAGDCGGVRRVDHGDHTMDAETFEAHVGGGAGGRDDEPVGVASGAGVRLSGDVDQLGQRWAAGRVDPVTETPGELGHLRPEPTDDD